MDISPFLKDLQQAGTRTRAIQDRRYHKSDRIHWGVPAATCNHLIRKHIENVPKTRLLCLAQTLWETNLFDPMIAAAKILGLPRVLPSAELWSLILSFLPAIDGWALEDTLARAAGKCLLANDSLLDEVEKWTHHENFWIRRAALVYTLPFAKQEYHLVRILEWAALYSSDGEWFIQKAIGWWLRVLGERRPQHVVDFLTVYGQNLKSVAKKEARRKMPFSYQSQLV